MENYSINKDGIGGEHVVMASEQHCVVMRDTRVMETDGYRAADRMSGMMLARKGEMPIDDIFEDAPSEKYPEDARMLVGAEGIRGKLLSELDPKVLDSLCSVWEIYPRESDLVKRAKAIRKRRKAA